MKRDFRRWMWKESRRKAVPRWQTWLAWGILIALGLLVARVMVAPY